MNIRDHHRIEMEAHTRQELQKFAGTRRKVVGLLIATMITAAFIRIVYKMQPPLTTEFVTEWLDWKNIILELAVVVFVVLVAIAIVFAVPMLNFWLKERSRRLALKKYEGSKEFKQRQEEQLAWNHWYMQWLQVERIIYSYQFRLSLLREEYLKNCLHFGFDGNFTITGTSDDGLTTFLGQGMLNGHILKVELVTRLKQWRRVNTNNSRITRLTINQKKASDLERNAFARKCWELVGAGSQFALELRDIQMTREKELAEIIASRRKSRRQFNASRKKWAAAKRAQHRLEALHEEALAEDKVRGRIEASFIKRLGING